MINNIFDFFYWEIHTDRPYFDDNRDAIKAYKLQTLGFKGYSFCNYSNFELNSVKKFIKETNSHLLEYYACYDHDKNIGEFNSKSVCLWTLHSNKLKDLFNLIPARTKTRFLNAKLKKKIPYENYAYFVGTEKIVLTYSDPDDFISIENHITQMKVLEKLTR